MNTLHGLLALVALIGVVCRLFRMHRTPDSPAITWNLWAGAHAAIGRAKIEHGKQTPSEDDIRVWCRLVDAEDHVPDLIATVRNISSAYMEWRREWRAGDQRIRGGASETLAKLLAVMPSGPSSVMVVTTVTPVAKRPSASRSSLSLKSGTPSPSAA